MRIRVKFHRFSGDVSKFVKIQMLERREPIDLGWYTLSTPAIKSFRTSIWRRERAVFKRQTRKLIEEQTQDEPDSDFNLD